MNSGVLVALRLGNTLTPLSTADQAARLVWLTESWPRPALSLSAVVKRSRICQSLVGAVKIASGTMVLAPTTVGAIILVRKVGDTILVSAGLAMTTALPVHLAQLKRPWLPAVCRRLVDLRK